MNRAMSRRSFFLAAILASLSAARPSPAAPGDEPTDKVFVGYVFGEPRNLNFRLYTHLCHAFLTADGDGNVRKARTVPSRELTGEAHRAGVKVLLSLGGWGWDEQFASIVSKPEAEDRYVEAVLGLVDGFDYDGIDLDWEYPDTEQEVVGFERLARRFRKGLDAIGARKGRPMVLTMAASSNPGTLRWLGKEFLLETMDWINVMTYDFTGDWTDYAGHHSPLFASSRQPGGRPARRRRRWSTCSGSGACPPTGWRWGSRSTAGASPSRSPTPPRRAPQVRIPRGDYRNLHRLRARGLDRIWDDETKNPWLVSPDGSTVIGYDDAESVALKTEWAMKRGFRGVFFWQVAGDRLPDGTNPLQEASRKEWDRGAGRDDRSR